MKKYKNLLFLLSLTLMFTSVGCDFHQKELPNKAGSLTDIEENIGTTVEEFSEKYGVETEIEYADDGEGGFPETGLFQVTINKAMIYGDLQIDYFKNDILDDHRVFINNINVELPYNNPFDIKLNDSIDTVKQKLDKLDIEYDFIDDETISFTYGKFHYYINFFNEGKLADQIGFSANSGSKEFKEDFFKKYCDAVPGGYYIQNGDYIVALNEGLLHINKENVEYNLDKDKAGGEIVQNGDLMVFYDCDGKRFKVDNENGDIALIEDSKGEGQGIDQESDVPQGASKVNTEKTQLEIIAVEQYGEWDLDTMLKVFGKPVAENYDDKGGTLYDGVILNQDMTNDQINSTTTQQNLSIMITSNKYSIYGFYVGMSEKEVSAKVKALGGSGSYGSYEFMQSPGNGESQTIVINCEWDSVSEISMQSFIAW